MLHNLALRRQLPFLQEEEAGDGRVAAVDPVDSEDEEAEDEDEDNRSAIICQYFEWHTALIQYVKRLEVIGSIAFCTEFYKAKGWAWCHGRELIRAPDPEESNSNI
ncbi:hypothetical protein NDU88_002052 [Pleurodeles waltl]|uniref:Uncharacterized protein n=1 Tax=Pleurodeles waltl TaxID=8319 RepID=A0AAV7VA46_PLEWA|nr:hypothetical protein NDU88_002052 [Pleurodeles waltl]